MQCLQCNSQNRDSNDYCESCGAPLGLRCEACSHVNGPSSRFCGQCGTMLAADAAGPAPSSQRLLQSLSSKGGERKRLTILFADIRNSTSLIDSLGDPELGMRRLEPVLNLMKEAVHRYDGIVNRIQGDGVMALFGAPRPHEDHAVRGCLAALSMQDAVARLEDPGLQIRVGLHSGEVVVQAIENSFYQTYDAAGANVHIAARMEQLADTGCILITRDTYVAARQFVEVEPLGPQSVRGIAAPIEAFRLMKLLNAPASDVFRSGNRLSSLIGRSDQFGALEAELKSVLNGDGRVVGIVGEAGIGKSRLCFEFAEHCRRQGIRVYEGRVLAHARATPFQPVLEVLRDVFDIRAKDSVAEARARITERLTALSSSERQLLVLLEFLGLGDAVHPAPKLDPNALKMELLDLVRTMVRAAPRDTATVFVIEDLHWIDAASEEFVEALADMVAGTTTLLVLNFRPGFVAALMQRPHYRQVVMPPLTAEQAELLLHQHCGDDPSLAVLTRNIIERAQGNPFFLEELVKAIVDRGDFEGARGAYRLKGGVDTLPLPSTVQAVIAARIDRLEETAKQVLETAAVIGRVVSLLVLQRVTAISHGELSGAIWHLRKADLLYDFPPFDQGLLAFRHPLIQEVAYATQLRSRLLVSHAAVAKAIEGFDWGKLDEFAGLLAFHYEAAGQTLDAITHLERSARWIGRTNSAEGLKSWKKVRALVLDQPRSEQNDGRLAYASSQILDLGWREGMPAEEAKIYAEETLAQAPNEPLLIAGYGRILATMGAADDYVRVTQDALKLTPSTGDVGRFATLQAMRSQALFLAGRLKESLDAGAVALSAIAEQGGFEGSVVLGLNANQLLGFDVEHWIKCLRTRILVRMGHFAEAKARLAEVLPLAPELITPVVQFIPHIASVEMAWALSEPDMAREHAARVQALARQSAMPYLRVAAHVCDGLARATEGDFEGGAQDIRAAIALSRSSRTGLEFEARMLADLAEMLFRADSVDAALQAAEEADAVAKRRTDRVAECHAVLIQGTIHAVTGKATEAARLVEQADLLLRVSGAAFFEPQRARLQLHLER